MKTWGKCAAALLVAASPQLAWAQEEKPKLPEPIRWEFPAVEERKPYSSSIDFLVAAPGDLLGSLAGGLRSLGSDPNTRSGSIFGRALGSLESPSQSTPLYGLTETWLDREERYFRRWPESPQATAEFEEDEEDGDVGSFMHDQRKVATHTLGRYYLSPYVDHFNEGLKREIFDFSRWESTDYVAGPLAIAGFLYFRGWEPKAKIGDFEFRFHFAAGERISRHLNSDHDYLVTAASLEAGVDGFPLKLIFSGGVRDGGPVVDFIGIGTSIAIARKAVKLEMAEDER